MRECKDEKFESSYYEAVAKTDVQEIANFKYSRDISQYSPKNFKESELHQEQVQKNLDSVGLFWADVLNGDMEFDYTWSNDKTTPTALIDKFFLYEKYTEQKFSQYLSAMPRNMFWKKLNGLNLMPQGP